MAKTKAKRSPSKISHTIVMPLGIAALSGVLIFLFISFFRGIFNDPLGFTWESALLASASALGIFVFFCIMQVPGARDIRKISDPGKPSSGGCTSDPETARPAKNDPL